MPVGHLLRLTNATSIEEVWKLHLDRMARYGFGRLLYGFTRWRSGSGFGDLRDAVVLSNHGKRYMDAYIGRGIYAFGPMIRWAAENVGACSWRHIGDLREKGLLDSKALEVLALNESVGMCAGYTISFREISARSGGAVGLCARRGLTQDDVEEIWTASGDEILLINNVTHMKITQLPQTAGRQLTGRQREVLEWAADGKTIRDMAVLMGLTAATVEKHLRRARDVMDAETTAQAIMKASVRNQFFALPV